MPQSKTPNETATPKVATALLVAADSADPADWFEEGRARDMLRTLDYAPAFEYPVRGLFHGQPPEMRPTDPTFAVFTDTMERPRVRTKVGYGHEDDPDSLVPGDRLYFEPASRVSVAGTYVAHFPKSDALTICRLIPSISGVVQVRYDNPAYEGHDVEPPYGVALRPLARVRRAGGSIAKRVAWARERGVIPTWS